MDATIDAPVKKRSHAKKEFHTSEVKPEQIPPVIDRGDLDDDSLLPKLHVVDKAKHPTLTKEYIAELAFNEEPVAVRFSSGIDRNAAKFVDAAVNGKGIEVLMDNGRWLEVFQVPVNQVVTMKRKYVEVFARCKHTDIQARSHGPTRDGTPPVNETIPSTNLKHPFSVIEDRNPRGHEWLTRILLGRA